MTADSYNVDVKVDPEFAALCPPLTDAERAGLEESLLAEGCLSPLIVAWIEGETVLLDGHNRLELCRMHGIPYLVKRACLGDRGGARNFIIDLQLGRRNLTPEQAAYLRGKKYLAEKKNPLDTLNKGDEPPRRQSGGTGRTVEKIAEQTGVSPKTIERDAEFAEAVDRIAVLEPAAKTAILNGTAPTTRAAIRVLRNADEAEVRRVAVKITSPAATKSFAKVAKRRDKGINDYVYSAADAARTAGRRVALITDRADRVSLRSVYRGSLNELWRAEAEIRRLREKLGVEPWSGAL